MRKSRRIRMNTRRLSIVWERRNKNSKVRLNPNNSISTPWRENKSRIFKKSKNPQKKSWKAHKTNSTKTSRTIIKPKSKNLKKIMNPYNTLFLILKPFSLRLLNNLFVKAPETDRQKTKASLRTMRLQNYWG